MSETSTYRFTLPGRDSLRIEAMAYAQGLHALPRMALESLPTDEPLPSVFVTNMPQEQEEITAMAQQIAELFINPDAEANKDMPVTNSPDLFREHYSKAFVEGYRFSLFAMAHSLLDLLAELPQDKHHELLYRFAWDKFVQESVYEPGEAHDVLMDEKVEDVKAIYKQYQSLN